MSHQIPEYIHITTKVSDKLSEIIHTLNPDKVGLLVDENTKSNCFPLIEITSDLIVEIESGELNKNLTSCSHIWQQLTAAGFTRKSVLINLGGGVIGDMGGFVASTYKRGISFINIPTTLLSQVDASIGGKQGIDFQGLKNHIGVFREPHAVIIDPIFLETLPKRELISGYAEVIKHALIYDASHWESLRNTPFDQLNWHEIIQKSVSIKSAVVDSDPFENGLRKILNYGHTLGHAIESHLLETEDRLLHGEAVAVGMILEGHLSLQLGMITARDFDQIRQHIHERYQLPSVLPAYEILEPLLRQDKKNKHNDISFSLLEEIGRCSFDQIVTKTQIESSIESYSK